MSSPKTQTSYLGGVPLERLYTKNAKKEDQPKAGRKRRLKPSKKPSNLVARKINEYEPHFGIPSVSGVSSSMSDFVSLVSLLCSNSAIPNSSDILREVEGMGALFLAIQGCDSLVSMLAVITLYLQRYHNKSNISYILDYVKSVFEFDTQSGDETPLSLTEPEWLTYIKKIENWKSVVRHKFFPQLSKMLSILVFTKMYDIVDLTFSLNGLILIQPDLQLLQSNSLDVVDASISTVIYFIENIYYSLASGSIKPFLMSDEVAIELDQEYALMQVWWSLVAVGNFTKHTGKDTREFNMRLENLIKRYKLQMVDKKSIERKVLSDRFGKLLDIKMRYERLRDTHGLRRAPFAMEFFGSSDVGKTTCASQMVDALLISAGFNTGKEYQYTRNPNDKNWSGARSSILTVGFDDMCNTKGAFVDQSPTHEWLAINNNEVFAPTMADLESKGKVFLEPVITFCTTNVKDLDAYTYSMCPFSIQRRSHVVTTVEVKPEYQKIINGADQGLDSAKVFDEYESKGINPPFDDIWECTVEVAVMPENLHELAKYEVVSFRGKPMRKVNIRTLAQFLIERFHEHLDTQEKIINRGNKRLEKGVLSICTAEGCNQIAGMCDLHDHSHGGAFGVPESIPEPIIDSKSTSWWDSCRSIFSRPTPIVAKEVCEEDEDGILTMYEEELTKTPHAGPESTDYGDKIYDGLCRAASIVKGRVIGDFSGSADAIESATTIALLGSAKIFSKYWDWMTIIPSHWLVNETFMKGLMLANVDTLKKRYFRNTIMNFALGSLACVSTCKNFHSPYLRAGCITSICTYAVIRQATMATSVECSYRRELIKRNVVSAGLTMFRDQHGPNIFRACGIIGGIYTVAKLYKRYRKLVPQGCLEPTTAEQIAQRDSEDNPWCQVVQRPLPMTDKSRCISPKDLTAKILNNLTYVSVRTSDRVLMANCLFLTTGVVIMPSHYFVENILHVTFRKENPEASSGSFSTYVSKMNSVRIPGTDLCLVYVDKGGSFANLCDFLPLENLPDHEFNMYWRKKDGEILDIQGRGKAGMTGTTFCKFMGGDYISLDSNTFPGMCGATLVGQGRGSCISGFHLGGESGTPWGCYGVLTKPLYEQGLEMLRDLPGVLITGSGDKFEEQVLGYKILTDKKLHPKSPLLWMPPESQIAYHGSCNGATTGHSDVKVTLISPIVTDIMGEPNVWGPPRIKGYYGWQKCLENLSVSALSMDPELLIVAMDDYKSGMLEIFSSPHIGEIRPLEENENMCGIPGLKFIDAIKLDTSAGHPLVGPKRRFVTETIDEDKVLHRKFDSFIIDEIQRCLGCYLRGERAYPATKAVKKDEALDKEKCRVIYVAPVALTYLVRQYFLPITRTMQNHPLMSECAVGINSHGPEWQELLQHITKYGDERLLGGDYAKYDQKLSSQLLLAALRILIDFAKQCKYTQEDIRIMEAMSGDLVYAMIAFNGDLISLTTGGHVSGNSLTVVLNGICGSLNLRCAFYSMYAKSIPFRSAVALSTYGDDNIGSVKEGFEHFNIKSASEFLSKHGQTYTMPDKESELVPYLPLKDLEYLKRRGVYCPEKDCIVGALCDKSIFKMLHCYLRPKGTVNSEKLACAINIGAALREWSNHGRSVYEHRHKQCVEICSIAGISGLCPELNLTYDDLVVDWKKKYNVNYKLYSTTLEVEE